MQIATVARLFRYPVKSMQGQELDELPVGFQGVPGDRRYAFVQTESRSPFPWLTARELNALLLYRPDYDEPFVEPAREPQLSVIAPDGERYSVFAPELRLHLEERLGRPLFLLRQGRGSYDVAPVSLFDQGLAAQIGRSAGVAVDPRRFRANIYVQAADAGYDEAALPGRLLAIGHSLRLAVTQQDARCVMITLDPDTAVSEPAVLHTVANELRNRAGLYGVVLSPGTVRRGDAVVLEE
jgi:uncharacterized protein YcbX